MMRHSGIARDMSLVYRRPFCDLFPLHSRLEQHGVCSVSSNPRSRGELLVSDGEHKMVERVDILNLERQRAARREEEPVGIERDVASRVRAVVVFCSSSGYVQPSR